jgi:GABA(A) receptor-associated protein
MTTFKDKYSFEQRHGEACSIMNKYPHRIPVIVERSKDTDIQDIDKKKFLVPNDITVGQFTYVIRKRIKLDPETAIFLFINDTLPASTSLMSQVYKENANKDLFLYVFYAGEQTFG